jgi:hypothetical protein
MPPDVNDEAPARRPIDWFNVVMYYAVISAVFVPWIILADGHRLNVLILYLFTTIILVFPYKLFLRWRGYDVNPRKYRWGDRGEGAQKH